MAMPSASGTTCGRRWTLPGATMRAMWPSPCSPTRTLPSLGTYSRSSGPLSPVASRMTGSPDETAGARDHGAGCTHGGGLALGLGKALGLGDGRAPAVLEEHAA